MKSADADDHGMADLHAYVDNCLDAAKRASMDQALAANENLRDRVEGWRRQNDAIRAAFEPVREAERAPPALASGGHLADGGLEIAPPGRRASGGVVAIVMAVIAGLLFAATPRNEGRETAVAPSRALSALIGASVAAYQTYAGDRIVPVEIGPASAEILQRWLRPQIGHDVPVPDLSQFGLTRLGARIVPGARSPAALLMYQDSSRARVAVYVEDGGARPILAPIADQAGAVTATAFSHGRGDFVVVGALGRARIMQIAAALQTSGDGAFSANH